MRHTPRGLTTEGVIRVVAKMYYGAGAKEARPVALRIRSTAREGAEQQQTFEVAAWVAGIGVLVLAIVWLVGWLATRPRQAPTYSRPTPTRSASSRNSAPSTARNTPQRVLSAYAREAAKDAGFTDVQDVTVQAGRDGSGGDWCVYVGCDERIGWTLETWFSLTRGRMVHWYRGFYQRAWAAGYEIQEAGIGVDLPRTTADGTTQTRRVYMTALSGHKARRTDWASADRWNMPQVWETTVMHPSLRGLE
jgi:hypothetical protein